MNARSSISRAAFAAEKQAKRPQWGREKRKRTYNEAARIRAAERTLAENCRLLGFAWIFIHCWPLHEDARVEVDSHQSKQTFEHLF